MKNKSHSLILLALFLSSFPLFSENGENLNPLRLPFAKGKNMAGLEVLDPRTELYKPLWDDEPRSSVWILSIDGEQIIPADLGWVLSEERTDKVLTKTHRTNLYDFTQKLSILPSGKHALWVLTFHNKSSQSVYVGINLLLDTTVDPSTESHFLLSNRREIKKEEHFQGTKIPSWIQSGNESNRLPLTFILEQQGVSPPLSLTLANWYRLREEGLQFSPLEGRTFDSLPFSNNDSAIFLRYKEEYIHPGKSQGLTILLGLNNQSPALPNASSPYTDILQKIAEIDLAVDKLDSLLEVDTSIASENIDQIEKTTEGWEKQRMEYEGL